MAATGTPADESDPAGEEEAGRSPRRWRGWTKRWRRSTPSTGPSWQACCAPAPTGSQDLTELARAVAGTPLAARVAEAAEKAAAGAASEEHFVALAAARTALFGAVHDALTLARRRG